MKRALTPCLILILASALQGPALSADAVETAVSSCWSCHGAGGPPKDPTIPIIQGQQAGYLEKQLHDFRSGERENQIMSSMAESIRPADVARASAMIAAMPWLRGGAQAGETAPGQVQGHTCISVCNLIGWGRGKENQLAVNAPIARHPGEGFYGSSLSAAASRPSPWPPSCR